MLPASDLTAILANLSALQLEPNTAAQILAAVLAPLLRSGDPVPGGLLTADKPSRRPRAQLRRAPAPRQRKRAKRHLAAAAAAPGEPTDSPRQRAARALAANPGVSLTRVAKIAGVSRSTVVNARGDVAAAARKQARREARQQVRSQTKPVPTDRRERARGFLRDELADGPKQVSAVEAAAEKAHVDATALAQARGDRGVVTSRGNAGGVMAVQWSLPG